MQNLYSSLLDKNVFDVLRGYIENLVLSIQIL